MNLIICCTPFQVILAEKIIDMYPDEEFHGVLFDTLGNDKYQYYAHRLKAKSHKFTYIKNVARTKLEKLYCLLKLRKVARKLDYSKITTIYLSSLDSASLQFLISHFKQLKHIKTFDDGTANINYDSFFYKERRGQLDIAAKLLGNKFSLQKIKEMSECHFSIYKNKRNVIENVIYLDLFAENKAIINANSECKEVNIFLGQPIFELIHSKNKKLINQKNIELANQVIKEFNIDFYLPHPREQYHIDNVEYINTNLIFEDYFIQNFNENIKYNIYTYFSGAVLSLNNQPNVKIIAIKPNINNPVIDSCYQIMQDYNIPCIEINYE